MRTLRVRLARAYDIRVMRYKRAATRADSREDLQRDECASSGAATGQSQQAREAPFDFR